jgi:hypothetical protein
MDALDRGEEREVRLALGNGGGMDLEDDVSTPVAVLVTGQRGSTGVTASFFLTPVVVVDTSTRSAAEILACRAAPSDPLVRSLPDLLLGSRREPSDPAGAVSAVLDMLDVLRSASPAPAVAGSLPVRQSLRSLDPSEQSWVVVMASIAASQGLRAGILAWPDKALLLVDTGFALDEAIGSWPWLAPYAEVLGKLARNGALCLPFDGRASLPSTADGAAAALRLCSRRGVDGAPVSWLDTLPESAAAPLPVPFPLALPATPPDAFSTSGFFAALRAALSAPPPS